MMEGITGGIRIWLLWANLMTTSTSLRFLNPKITLSWIVVYPFGIVLGLSAVVLTLLLTLGEMG